MQKRIPIKNHHQEVQLVAQRSMLAFIGICLLLCCLIARLAYLQIYKQDLYTTLATKNWLDLQPIEPTRGLIYDRNGILLAENIPVFSLDVIPVQVSNFAETLLELKKIIDISDEDIRQYTKQVKQHRRFDEIPLKLRLSEEEVARFAENQHRFTGVVVKARLMRHYPLGNSFSHVLGYVGRINTKELNEIDQTNYSASHYIGKSGIEKFYEDDLHGTVGYEQVENNASGEAIRTLKEIKGIPGKNLYLTIDSNLQLAAERALQGNRGAVVAIQPSTGQVLAMVSEPTFDPNLFVLGISRKDFSELQSSRNRPLYNRALRGLYPLASTIKPYIALAGLDSGIISTDFAIFDPGWFQLRNSEHHFRDWQHLGHGTVNVTKAITVSCDTFFYELAVRMGIHRIANMLNQFGFGAPTGIDLDDESAGIVASPEWKRKMRGAHWYEGDTVISGIGQGYMQATPLQLASAVSTLANRGKRFMPYLLLGEQLPGNPYVQQPPVPLDTVALKNEGNWETVIKAMRDVIESPGGTAYRFGHNLPYTAAGKTGTAQVIARRGNNADEEDNQSLIAEHLRDHRLFIVFAPADHPKIALAIITENSNLAIEAARDIVDYYLGKHENANRQSQAETEKTPA